MARTQKIKSIITALETIEPTTFEQLCADLLCAGALVPELRKMPVRVTGSSLANNTTLPYPVDGIFELPEGRWVLQCSKEKDWVGKLKHDVKSVKRWAEMESRPLVGMIFITSRKIGNREIGRRGEEQQRPAEFIERELSQVNTQVQAYVFGQEALLEALQRREYSDIRREWLNIPDDYFLSRKIFKSYHFNQARDRRIYLKSFVPSTVTLGRIKMLEDFAGHSENRVLLIHGRAGIGKTRFILESLSVVKRQVKNVDMLFNQRQTHANVDEILTEISEDRNSLIVLDDAHLIDNLTDFAKILIHRIRAKIILIARPTARQAVVQAIGYPAGEIELTPLDQDASVELLKSNLKTPLFDEFLKEAAGRFDGNPLLIESRPTL